MSHRGHAHTRPRRARGVSGVERAYLRKHFVLPENILYLAHKIFEAECLRRTTSIESVSKCRVRIDQLDRKPTC